MKENITTIPISEIFLTRGGCPVCRLRSAVERHILEFLTGGAVMEPDVRIQTNQQGFCKLHYTQLLDMQNKLCAALMMQSRLDELMMKLSLQKLSEKDVNTCYVCGHAEKSMEQLLDTIVKTYSKEPDFRADFDCQPMLCLPHYIQCVGAARKALKKSDCENFCRSANAVTKRGLEELRNDVAWFCEKYDYRNTDKPWGGAKDSLERGVFMLTSR